MGKYLLYNYIQKTQPYFPAYMLIRPVAFLRNFATEKFNNLLKQQVNDQLQEISYFRSPLYGMCGRSGAKLTG